MANAIGSRSDALSTIQTFVEATQVSCETTRTSVDEQLRAITAALNQSRDDSTSHHQGMENKMSLVLDAVQSMLSTMCVQDDQREKQRGEENSDGSGHQPSPAERSTKPSNPSSREEAENARVLACVDRLRSLVDQSNDATTDEQVDSIIDDLQTILASVHSEQEDRVTVKDMKRIGGLLSSAQRLSINETGAC